MRILLSNDDGIGAPGLALLTSAARLVTEDVWVVAPVRKWTAASHQLSFDTRLRLTRQAERTYACSGAPADCVVAALAILLAGNSRPDLVLSGVNDDSNVGEDAIYSGTLAIAREATFWGIPAVGFSRPRGSAPAPEDEGCLARLIESLWRQRNRWALEGHFLSVNLPRALPARVAEARTGRDKIAGSVDILARDGNADVSFQIRRGRPGTRLPGDQRSQIDAGLISVVRYTWAGGERLPDDIVAELSARATGR